ncbi:pyocin knob domain-containing protein [Pseudomonas sp. ArH3a]|uniref:pyocin knob domain-containing protein n=1 Tax=Pseudomonas sp. ArH3a TaxID=2862945 RepID=UPI001F5AC03E|nr:pyocin knob domain-containing protein [Pseudomonas sp. ArH3a]UNM22140.1 pyocin knob domain-containing protein [Pseudomonas sp. ArH3a]
MARQEIILGMPPQGLGGDPPRTASMKINAMTRELYQGLDATTKSGWGWATPVIMPSGTNANDLRGNFIAQFNEGGANLPVTSGGIKDYWFVRTFENGAAYCSQEAVSFVAPNATYHRQRHASSGWTPWKKVIEQGDFGLGQQFNPWVASLNNFSETQAFSYGINTTANMIPGMDYGEGIFIAGQNGASEGIMLMMNHDSDRMFIKRKRQGNYSSGNEVFTKGNVLSNLDDTSNQGLMDVRSVGGWMVRRFLNGTMIAQTGGAPRTEDFAPGEQRHQGVDCPVTFVSPVTASVLVRLHPSGSWAFPGVNSAYMDNGTRVTYSIINGPTAQFFGVATLTVIGSWK